MSWGLDWLVTSFIVGFSAGVCADFFCRWLRRLRRGAKPHFSFTVKGKQKKLQMGYTSHDDLSPEVWAFVSHALPPTATTTSNQTETEDSQNAG